MSEHPKKERTKPRPPSERVMVAGQTESGKTTFLQRHFLNQSRARRLLILDRTGEWRDDPYSVCTFGIRDLLGLLEDCAKRRTWRIVSILDNNELATLAGVLLGLPDARRGYCFNVGGMALALSEIDLLVPQGAAPEALRSLWRRGSHAGLSIYADTQRPSNVNKETTSQCRWLGFLALYEPRCITYMTEVLGSMSVEALRWTQAAQYQCALLDQRTRKCYLVDAYGRVKTTLGGHNDANTDTGRAGREGD